MKKKTERHQPHLKSIFYANRTYDGGLFNEFPSSCWAALREAYYKGYLDGQRTERRIANANVKGRKKCQ